MKSLNIMIVDDSAIIIKKLKKIIEQLGHNVVAEANTGLQAILRYGKYNPDLVTMDITMPKMDGIEAVKQIKNEYEDALIVMVTSHGQEQIVINAIKAGAIGYILKPFKKDKIIEQIDIVINEFL